MQPSRPTVLATICARGGSKGVPGKNIRLLAGRPLIAYAIDCARACSAIDDIVVSTDSREIASVAESHGLPVPFLRPKRLASDDAAKAHAILHATKYVEKHRNFSPDIVVDLDVGVPLRSPADVQRCVDLLASNPLLQAAVTIYEAERNPYFNMVELDGDRVRLVKRPPSPVVRRQAAPEVYSVSPSVFAFRRSCLGEIVHLYHGKWGGVTVPRERAIDIDTETDFLFLEFLLARQEGRGARPA